MLRQRQHLRRSPDLSAAAPLSLPSRCSRPARLVLPLGQARTRFVSTLMRTPASSCTLSRDPITGPLIVRGSVSPSRAPRSRISYGCKPLGYGYRLDSTGLDPRFIITHPSPHPLPPRPRDQGPLDRAGHVHHVRRRCRPPPPPRQAHPPRRCPGARGRFLVDLLKEGW